MKIGIFVGRFQTPELHNGYKYVMSELQINYDYYAIIIGSSLIQDQRNPLDFTTRKSMIEQYVYKKPFAITEIKDVGDNDVWNKILEEIIINELKEANIEFDLKDIYLIGSRDSFVLSYSGRCKTILLEPYGNYNSTQLRKEVKFTFDNNFIFGFAFYVIKKYFKFNLNWLKPVNNYNSNWSKGYIFGNKIL